MKRLLKAAAVLGVSAVVFTGCATKSYVDQQVAPLKEKLNQLEQRVNDLEGVKAQVQANSQKLQEIEREHADIKAQLRQVEGTANAAYTKATNNEQAIEDLNATIQRQSKNLERILGKHYAK